MTEKRHDEDLPDDVKDEVSDHSDEHPVTRREALETELMEHGDSEEGEEIGEQID